jgi:hypothetical protein
MPSQNTPSPALRGILEHWHQVARGDDPVEAAVAQHMLAQWRTATRRVGESHDQDEDRPPERWARCLADLIDTDEQHWSDTEHFKTGHSLAHSSRSGTCLSVNLTRGRWYCSSCHRHGDAIGWLVQHQGMSRGQAWMALRRRYGDPYAQA